MIPPPPKSNRTSTLCPFTTRFRSILQAITHFGFLGDEGIDAHANPSHETGKSDLVIVYHRLPYEEFFEKGKLIPRPPTSPNGLLPTLLRFFSDGPRGAWAAWAVDDTKRGAFGLARTVVEQHCPHLYDPRRIGNARSGDGRGAEGRI